jgi:hypothetical protein
MGFPYKFDVPQKIRLFGRKELGLLLPGRDFFGATPLIGIYRDEQEAGGTSIS